MCICMLNMLLGAIAEVGAFLCMHLYESVTGYYCFWGSGNFSESSLRKVNIAGDQVLRSPLGSLVLYYPVNQYKYASFSH
ncbi:hypothetical protein Tco_0501778 [Tanacetum coccineum]